jgi:lysophospholipid acyltransferase (LPLAT)-like uncharacterized protein
MGRVSGPARDSTFREELKIRAASGAASLVHALLTRTYCWRVAGRPHQALRDAGEPARCVYSVWHAHIWVLLRGLHGQQLSVMVSEHRDGEAIARIVRRLGFATVRGSSTRGRARALLELARAGREGPGDLLLTVDGPRGPAGEVKQGVVFAASRTGLPVVPVGVAAANAWRVGSWDRHLLPRPFSRVAVVYGQPIAVSPDADREELAARWTPAVAEGMQQAGERAAQLLADG